jgi:hypothetical protein
VPGGHVVDDSENVGINRTQPIGNQQTLEAVGIGVKYLFSHTTCDVTTKNLTEFLTGQNTEQSRSATWPTIMFGDTVYKFSAKFPTFYQLIRVQTNRF